jgi:hypothetical protein
MYFRLDQLSKNILRDGFVPAGAPDTEVEVLPGDAQRIDVLHVPDPAKLAAATEITPGLFRRMASEGGIVEIWSAAPDLADFHSCMRKRFQWHHTLEQRNKKRMALTSVWFVSAGRPDTVLRDFGLVPDAAGPEGLYTTAAPGWRLYIVVIGELPRERGTLLLRLLGSKRVRRMALQDLAALPEDAWERRVALPWLVRLSFEVPAELLPDLPVEERELIMETREWYEQFEARRREQEAQRLKQAEERGKLEGKLEEKLQLMARLCGLRLGRPLTEAENAALAERLDRLGEDRVGQVMLSFSSEALQAWLSDPNAQ